jgi:diaminopimelate epimerase
MPIDTYDMPVSWDVLDHPMAVNVGNPHVIFFVDDCDVVPLETLGTIIETDPLFPERINVNVATITGANTVKLRVWERGVGLTRACGTGACATAVAAIRSKRVSSPVTVSLPGGDLIIEWDAGGAIKMNGAATYVFSGNADWDDFG